MNDLNQIPYVEPETHNLGSSAFDHVAFPAIDPSIVINRLNENGHDYRERKVPDLDLFQIFVEDPNGVTVELNYFAGEQKAA